MYFAAPPDGASRALLEGGASSQRVIHGGAPRRKASRAHTQQQPVDAALRASSGRRPTDEPPAEESTKLMTGPRTQKPVEEEPDELTLINDRVAKVLQNYSGQDEHTGQEEPADQLSATDFDALKHDIHALLGRQEDMGNVRTLALSNLVDSLGRDQGEEDAEATGESQMLSDDGQDPQIDNLVGDATENQRKKVSKLNAVHKQEATMVKDLVLAAKQLESDMVKKDAEVYAARQQAMAMEERLAESEGRCSELQEELEQAVARVGKLEQDLQTELDKPPPAPQLIGQAELDALKANYDKARRELTTVREELILREEELKEASGRVATLSASLKSQQEKSKTLERSLAQANAKHETELAQLNAQKAELQSKLETTAAALASSEEFAQEAREQALKEAELQMRHLREALDHAKEETVARALAIEEEMKAQLAKQKAEADRLISKVAMDAAQAKEEARHVVQESREQVEEAQTLAHDAAQSNAGAAALRAVFDQQMKRMRAQAEEEINAARARSQAEIDAAAAEAEAAARRESDRGAQRATEDSARLQDLERHVDRLEAEVRDLKSKLKAALFEVETMKEENRELKENAGSVMASVASTEATDAATKLAAAARGRATRTAALVGFKKVDDEDKLAKSVREPADPARAFARSRKRPPLPFRRSPGRTRAPSTLGRLGCGRRASWPPSTSTCRN